MRYELRRLETLGALYPDHPNHNVRYVALKDAALSLPHVKNVLVLGCGRGLVEYLLPEGWRCTGVDLSEYQIDAAREINRFKRNRTFHVGDLYNLKDTLQDQKFDLVVISEVIEHIEEDARALQIAFDYVAPGGHFLLTVPHLHRFHNRLQLMLGKQPFLMTTDHVREYTYKHTRDLLKKTGFRIIRWRGVWFEFPKPGAVERFIDPCSPIRSLLAFLAPRLATYLLFTCQKPAGAGVDRR